MREAHMGEEEVGTSDLLGSLKVPDKGPRVKERRRQMRKHDSVGKIGHHYV